MKNKLLTALLSAVVALGLWTYVVTVVSPNSDRQYHNVSVTIQGETMLQERGLMIVNRDVPTVSLQLKGNRTDLDKLNSSNITLTADVSRIYDPGTHNLRFTPSYPGDVASGAISVLSQNPVAITIEVEERVSKPVPVSIHYNGTLPDSFMADEENSQLDYEHVNVIGPKSVVDKIAMAQINVDLTDRVESISQQYTYTLCDENGEPVDAQLVTTDVESVMLTLRIVRVKQIQLLLNVINGGGATKENTQITFESSNELQISGSDNLLENLESLEIGTIDLGLMEEDGELSFPIKLPEGVTNETGVSEIKVTVKLPELETKTLTVTEFKTVNVPEGQEVDLITQALEIKMRGPKDKIEELTEEAITITVDFAEAQTGTVKVKAQIASSVTEVGAVGVYTVSATLREAARNS